jgi:hypothetical protein
LKIFLVGAGGVNEVTIAIEIESPHLRNLQAFHANR